MNHTKYKKLCNKKHDNEEGLGKKKSYINVLKPVCRIFRDINSAISTIGSFRKFCNNHENEVGNQNCLFSTNNENIIQEQGSIAYSMHQLLT